MEFLRESWNRKAEEETGQATETMGDIRFDAFLAIKNNTKNIPENTPKEIKELIKEYYDELLESMERYVNIIGDYNIEKESKNSRETMAQIDHSRRLIHNGLISIIDTLSKLHKKAGLDNSWREVVGYDRNRVREFAQIVITTLAKQEERRLK